MEEVHLRLCSRGRGRWRRRGIRRPRGRLGRDHHRFHCPRSDPIRLPLVCPRGRERKMEGLGDDKTDGEENYLTGRRLTFGSVRVGEGRGRSSEGVIKENKIMGGESAKEYARRSFIRAGMLSHTQAVRMRPRTAMRPGSAGWLFPRLVLNVLWPSRDFGLGLGRAVDQRANTQTERVTVRWTARTTPTESYTRDFGPVCWGLKDL